MSKAVLVIDVPKNCKECILSVQSREVHNGVFCWRCAYAPTHVINRTGKKPDWCPLVPMPEKDNELGYHDDYSDGCRDGWNAAIDAIGGNDSDGEAGN